ncbi:MAG: hypothetical protein KKI04_06505, partial [Proteobacteria bacterium]|nr:hypothetical protein [Pseudomonadota bacterium]
YIKRGRLADPAKDNEAVINENFAQAHGFNLGDRFAAIITHNADIAGMADRVIHLSNGRITEVKVNTVKKSPGELQW